VYETIEGPLMDATCLLDPPICDGQCMLGGLLHALNGEARRFLAQSTVADLAGTVLTVLTAGDRPTAKHS
jgi:DNA-binding IscR family transcriptional regulator